MKSFNEEASLDDGPTLGSETIEFQLLLQVSSSSNDKDCYYIYSNDDLGKELATEEDTHIYN